MYRYRTLSYGRPPFATIKRCYDGITWITRRYSYMTPASVIRVDRYIEHNLWALGDITLHV